MTNQTNQTNAPNVTIGDEYYHREVDVFYHDVVLNDQRIGVLFRFAGSDNWGFDIDADETRFDGSELNQFRDGQTPWETPEEGRKAIGTMVKETFASSARPAQAEEQGHAHEEATAEM